MKEKWNDVYTTRFGGMWYPSEGFVKFTARYLKRRVGIDLFDTKKEVNRILDAGCGAGRHVIYFAEQGFEVYGVDIEQKAIELGKAWLTKEDLKAELRLGDIKELPFKNDYFDVVISYGVLDHILFSEAKLAMEEIKRVIAPDGYVFMNLRSTVDSECGRGEEKEHNTFVLQEGYEQGIIQHYFDIDEINDLFLGFRIFDIYRDDEIFPSEFTIDKAYLQSSQGRKKYIDLSKPVDMNLKYSRWYIAAEKV